MKPTLKPLVISLMTGLAIMSSTMQGRCAEPATARGMFFEQMNKPQDKINTGFIYWVELERAGQKSRVSNKAEFVENDHVRFHFKPNFDGYAYVYLVENEGKGDKTLLFPSKELTDNKVKAGNEITLPFTNGKDQAWLKFDDHPGTEIVRIVVSRDAMDPKDADGSKDMKASLSLSADRTHADKVPDGTFVSMEPLGGMVLGSRGLSLDVIKAPEQKGEVAVVSANPTKPLSIDISLTHKKKD